MKAPEATGQAWLGLGVLSLCWGTSFLFTDVALRTLSPPVIVAARIAVAALALNLLRIRAGLALPRELATWRRFAMLAVTGSAVPFLLISWGQVEVSSGLCSILMTVTPLVTAGLAHVIFDNEPATSRKWLGMLVGFIGVVVLLDPMALLEVGAGDGTWRQLAILGGACCYAVNTILARRIAGTPPLVYGSGVLAVSAVLAGLNAFASAPTPGVGAPGAWLAVVWLGLVPTAAATQLHFRIVASAGATFATYTSYLIPGVALIAGALVLGESITARALVALAMVLGGVFLAQSQPRRTETSPGRPMRGMPQSA